MTAVHLRIDHVAVELGDGAAPGSAEATLRTALEVLAARLAGAPLGGAARAGRLALERLELEPLAPEALTGPGAADRLADRLYRGIVGALPAAGGPT